MQRSGEPLRWRSESGEWMPAGDGDAPFFMRRPSFASLKGPAVWLYWLLGGLAVATVLAMAADAYLVSVMDRARYGNAFSSEVEGAEGLYWGAKLFQWVFFYSIPWFFLWWTRRATCNVRALGAVRPTFSPGAAIGWWFVPFAGMVQPLRVIRQAWRASAPELGPDDSEGWREAGVTGWLVVWWVCFLVTQAVWVGFGASLDSETMTESDMMDVAGTVMVLDAVLLAVTGLTVWVIGALTARQEEANRKFNVVSDAVGSYGVESTGRMGIPRAAR